MKEDTRSSHAPRHRQLNGKSKTCTPYIPREGKNMGDWWNEDIVRTAVSNQRIDCNKEHPALFPEKIVILPILQTTDKNDLVLDPFMGSGTTGKVANELERNFVGYDVKTY